MFRAHSADEIHVNEREESSLTKFRKSKSAEFVEFEELELLIQIESSNLKVKEAENYTSASTKLLFTLLRNWTQTEKKKNCSNGYFDKTDFVNNDEKTKASKWSEDSEVHRRTCPKEEQICSESKKKYHSISNNILLNPERKKEESFAECFHPSSSSCIFQGDIIEKCEICGRDSCLPLTGKADKPDELVGLNSQDFPEIDNKSLFDDLFTSTDKQNSGRENTEKTEKSVFSTDCIGMTNKTIKLFEEPPKRSDSINNEILRLLRLIDDNGDCIKENDRETGEDMGFKETISNADDSEFPGKTPDLNNIHFLLDEMEKESEVLLRESANDEKLLSPRLEELTKSNPVELAYEILALELKVEDQKKSIKLLRETLLEMKTKNEEAEADRQKVLNKANAEAEGLIQRHQKLIRQLLNEKKYLNETITKLVLDFKVKEEKFNKSVKILKEKHQLDMKRSKEAQALADKLKREKWMAMKTEKIKEMTIKSLEPELSQMADRQQQEIMELKNIQRAEMEAVELKATRRASQLMDELRAELLKEKAAAIQRETSNLRTKMEKDFEEERNRMEISQQKLKDELRKQEERLANRESEFRRRIMEMRKEADDEREKLMREFQEKANETENRHLFEMKEFREIAVKEKETLEIFYKEKELAKFHELESELHKRYKMERDRDIEKIIDALEKEYAQLKLKMEETSENKLKRLEESVKKEIAEAELKEIGLREKLTEIKSQLTEKEELIAELDAKIRCLQVESNSFKLRCEDLTFERNDLKEEIRKEFEGRVAEMAKNYQNIESEMVTLKENHLQELAKKDQIFAQKEIEMQKELVKVYKRIQMVASKKETVIESLKKENEAKAQRCLQLEILLQNQRKNLLLQ